MLTQERGFPLTKKTKSIADALFPEIPEDEHYDVLDIPPNKRKLHTESYDFSISTIYDHLKSGHIYIPRFQRSFVWNMGQASRLIESLVIQCPIPVLYFDQLYDSRFSVIDGNQRLTSIKLYLDDEFSLKGLTAYPELENSYWSDLDPRIQRHILNRTMRCIAILPDTHPQIKFDVFERLNTGSVQLTAQELRHGIYHGKLINLIETLSRNDIWKKITRIKQDKRMKRAELVLRFLALAHELNEYEKPLSGFLNNFAEKYQNPNQKCLDEFSNHFLNAVKKMDTLYGELSFRPFDKSLKAQNAINAALFDAQMVAIYKVNPNVNNFNAKKRETLLDNTAKLFENQDFRKTIGAGTSAKTSVLKRINMFTEFISKELGK